MSAISGTYTPPKKLQIQGIETLVVDPHNQVLEHWYTLKTIPAVLLHIDDHADMASGALTYEKARTITRGLTPEFADFLEYIDRAVNIAQFNAVAMHDGIIGAMYHVAPRYKEITAFGRVSENGFYNAPKIKVDESGKIRWQEHSDFARGDWMHEQDLAEDLRKINAPIILDIDLDAFHLKEHDPINRSYTDRIEKTGRLLQQLPKPAIITIARSQTPRAYVHPELVDRIEADCIAMLKDTYK